MQYVSVREASANEQEIIAAFQLEMAAETENIILDKNTINRGVQAVFDDPGKGRYYVATHENEVVACMLTTYEWSDWRNGTFIWLQSVYVLPEWRGKGVFRSLYAHIESMVLASTAMKGIRLYVFHTNKKAQDVYKAIGMEDQHYRMFEWVKP